MGTSVTHSVSQFLTFKLDQELFAMEVGSIREILEFSTMTRVPGMPDYVRGVLNLRGSVVPIVDLKLKLGIGLAHLTVHSCVVILEIIVDGERTVLGALVDSVQDVINLDASQVAPPVRMGTRIDSMAIRGMGKRDDRFVMILDLDRIFSAHELRVGGRESPQNQQPQPHT
jgi:purine-binding chemotaxis protein CheW